MKSLPGPSMDAQGSRRAPPQAFPLFGVPSLFPLKQMWLGRDKVVDSGSPNGPRPLLKVSSNGLEIIGTYGTLFLQKLPWSDMIEIKFTGSSRTAYIITRMKERGLNVSFLLDSDSQLWKSEDWYRLVYTWRTLRDISFDPGYKLTEISVSAAVDHHASLGGDPIQSVPSTSSNSAAECNESPEMPGQMTLVVEILRDVLRTKIENRPYTLTPKQCKQLKAKEALLSEQWVLKMLSGNAATEDRSRKRTREDSDTTARPAPADRVKGMELEQAEALPRKRKREECETTARPAPATREKEAEREQTDALEEEGIHFDRDLVPHLSMLAVAPSSFLESPAPHSPTPTSAEVPMSKTTIHGSCIGPKQRKLLKTSLNLTEELFSLVQAAQFGATTNRLRVQLRCISFSDFTTHQDNHAALMAAPISWPSTSNLSIVASINDADWPRLSPPKEGPTEPADITHTLQKDNRVVITVTGDHSSRVFMLVLVED